MALIVHPADPRDPPVTAILQQSHALMSELFEPEENSYLSVEELCDETVHMFAAALDGVIVGTGALAVKAGYGEVKSMFTLPAARGHGAAAALLDHIETTARALNLPLLRLETGDVLDSAQRLYRAKGFTTCAAFGDYDPNAPRSVYMEKRLV